MKSLAPIIILLTCTVAWTHKFHASLAQVEINPETRSAEITLRLFADDLEKGLSLKTGAHVVLDRDPEIEPKIFAYLQDYFRIRDKRDVSLEPVWIGMEHDVHSVWIYLEMPMPDGWRGHGLWNRIFFDLFEDQINTVNIKIEGKVQTLIFKPGDGYKKLPGD